MNQYVGKTCPYCKAAFTDDDEIVVCSECDMPHHKECWVENQGCTTFGCNGTIQSVEQASEVSTIVNDDGDFEIELYPSDVDFSSAYCPKCGSSHDPTDLFCKHCGQSFEVHFNKAEAKNSYTNTSSTSVEYTTAHISPSEKDRDDEKALVGTNYEYYGLKFAEIRNSSKRTSWNWAAFLFAPYWCIYRKMYGFGAALLGGAFILSFLGIVGSILMLAGYIVFGFYANYLYLQQIDRKVVVVRGMDEYLRPAYFQKNGGTNTLAVVLTVIGYSIITMVIYL